MHAVSLLSESVLDSSLIALSRLLSSFSVVEEELGSEAIICNI